MMKTATVPTTISDVKVNKPTQQDIKLDLDRILEKVWNQGLPNGILNGL
ncbi:MAG: hypothetical protein AAGE84_25550 [Cyanobacteria bacterium P01_G01_bin.39]